MKKIFAFCVVISSLFGRDICNEEFMIEAVNDINSQVPYNVDKSTILRNTACIKDTFVYSMVVTNTDETDWSSLDELELRKIKYVMGVMTENNYCTNPNMRFFRELRVPLQYDYALFNGKFLFSIHIKPNQCDNF
ncbi:hypothetical protein OFO01_05470 [Campylobacter sp. JMF_01 NE2]|uniref:hypothetical protein n=1 Tax=unclassified Campylobacter TaxID=2593542 RepID=UPI0022E9CB6E|nr:MULTISPECIES: hypothetical protein [unclassified Campylobacter]MDA3052902.1 hypothetical protein [Campylobacter sp. JMF_03 NE3]MDA3067233.1 hypothetical protein [Campylobacter sp. JMF_01 NE2]